MTPPLQIKTNATTAVELPSAEEIRERLNAVNREADVLHKLLRIAEQFPPVPAAQQAKTTGAGRG